MREKPPASCRCRLSATTKGFSTSKGPCPAEEAAPRHHRLCGRIRPPKSAGTGGSKDHQNSARAASAKVRHGKGREGSKKNLMAGRPAAGHPRHLLVGLDQGPRLYLFPGRDGRSSDRSEWLPRRRRSAVKAAGMTKARSRCTRCATASRTHLSRTETDIRSQVLLRDTIIWVVGPARYTEGRQPIRIRGRRRGPARSPVAEVKGHTWRSAGRDAA